MARLYKQADEVLEGITGTLNEAEILYSLQTKNIDRRYINTMKEYTHFSYEAISTWLNITPRTLRSYAKQNSPLSENIKEHLLLLLSLFMHGHNVFGSPENFEHWLRLENFYFDGKAPVSYLNTVTGIRYVDNRIIAMEYGDNV